MREKEKFKADTHQLKAEDVDEHYKSYYPERKKSSERKDEKRRSSSRKRHRRRSRDNNEREYKCKKYHFYKEEDEKSSGGDEKTGEGRYRRNYKREQGYSKRKGYDTQYEDKRKYERKNSENESQHEEEHKPANKEDWDNDLVSKRNKNEGKTDELSNDQAENKLEEIKITESKIISLNQRNNDLRKEQPPSKRPVQEVSTKDEVKESDKISSKFVIKQEGDRKIIETKALKAAAKTTPKSKDDLRERIKALREAENK
jgi:hypothetical protein